MEKTAEKYRAQFGAPRGAGAYITRLDVYKRQQYSPIIGKIKKIRNTHHSTSSIWKAR